MRLRSRFHTAFRSRVSAHLPEALATVWNAEGVVLIVEQLAFAPGGGFDGEWELRSAFTGVVRAELRVDEVDMMACEPLLANLVTQPVHLHFDGDVPEGGLSERARLVLLEWRDLVRDGMVISGLRFSVEGDLARRVLPPDMPLTVVAGGAS